MGLGGSVANNYSNLRAWIAFSIGIVICACANTSIEEYITRNLEEEKNRWLINRLDWQTG